MDINYVDNYASFQEIMNSGAKWHIFEIDMAHSKLVATGIIQWCAKNVERWCFLGTGKLCFKSEHDILMLKLAFNL